jgi:hypothetical protein
LLGAERIWGGEEAVGRLSKVIFGLGAEKSVEISWVAIGEDLGETLRERVNILQEGKGNDRETAYFFKLCRHNYQTLFQLESLLLFQALHSLRGQDPLGIEASSFESGERSRQDRVEE